MTSSLPGIATTVFAMSSMDSKFPEGSSVMRSNSVLTRPPGTMMFRSRKKL